MTRPTSSQSPRMMHGILSAIPVDTVRLFTVLGDANLRYVGGCVRNALLGVPVGDIDLATTLSPQQVVDKLAKANIKTVPTGIDYGTVTAVINGTGYEITTLRRDVETDGRRAVVAYTTDWAEDAVRRDFTMNALYADRQGVVYDPLGTGLPDIDKRKVRFLGDAETRIREDYLRILRFFRFHAAYGRGQPDKKALAACEKFAPDIATLSRERITQEFTKILMGASPQKILTVMQTARILPSILGKRFDPDRFTSLLKIQKRCDNVDKDVLFCSRLFMLCGFSATTKDKIFNILILNKKQLSILEDITRFKIDTTRLTNIKMMEYLYLYSWNSVAAALMIAAVKDEIPAPQFKKTWTIFSNTQRPVCPVSGKNLMALGYPQGVELGKALAHLEQKWIASGFVLTRNELLDREKTRGKIK